MSWPSMNRGPVQAVKPVRAQKVQEGADEKVTIWDKNCEACYAAVQDKAGDADSRLEETRPLASGH